MNEHKRFGIRARGLYRTLIVFCSAALILAVVAFYYLSRNAPESDGYSEVSTEDPEKIEDGVHVRTGLLAAEGYKEVITNCTGCHSAQLVTQNRMDAKGWEATIRWMQKTQNLWDLGESETVIIDYLVTNYPIEKKGRRESLKQIEWYRLKPEGP